MSILTQEEASNILRCAQDDPKMITLLPQVDAYIHQATGRDWSEDDPVHAGAKSAARMLIVRAYEDPGALSLTADGISFALPAVLLQLETMAEGMDG